jgi:transposase InsO family protein
MNFRPFSPKVGSRASRLPTPAKRYEKATRGQKEKAERSFAIAHACLDLERAGLPQTRIQEELKKQFGKGASKATLWRIQQAIKGQDESIWLPLLLPEWKGKTHCAPFTEEAFEHIWADWGRQEQPSLKAVYRRAQKLAPEKGWKIPSYDTVKARIDTMPHDQKVLMREGERALARLYPAQKRVYSSLQLHDIWCADGHEADVFVKDEAGEIFRPIVMGWMDVRSRVLLGWAVAKSETADLVRRALHQAITRSNAVPREALMDNGRAFASKEISGGVPNRYRFKVKENEVLGTLPLLGVGVVWATPGHGQAKPIESFWRNLTEMVKRSEFSQACCGNNPDAKPEHFDKSKAVPLAVFKRVLAETIADYHAREHRGDAMAGKCPQTVYEELAQTTPIRQPTAAQIRFCLMTAEATRLKGEEGSIQLNGNRYWSPEISGLSRTATYTVRYNPEDARAPVSLYLNERRICEVPIVGEVAFRNRDEAKKHANNRRAWVKTVKQSDDALARLRQTESGVFRLQVEDPDPATPAMPRPKIAEPVRPRLQMPVVTKQTEEEDETPLLSPAQFMEMLARKEAGKGR